MQHPCDILMLCTSRGQLSDLNLTIWPTFTSSSTFQRWYCLPSTQARHSPESSAIRVSAVREGVHVAVSVSDEGQGVSPELLPHLFRKFSRIEGDERGSGVGDTGLAGHLPGHRGGPRGTHLGRERGAGPGSPVHLHPSGGGRDGQWPSGPDRPADKRLPGRECGAHPGGGRRPPRTSGTSATPSPGRATRRW